MTKLQFLRLRSGVSQKDLAAILGIPVQVLNRIERGWFAKPPRGAEVALRNHFGDEWTFERLMDRVPDITASVEASRR